MSSEILGRIFEILWPKARNTTGKAFDWNLRPQNLYGTFGFRIAREQLFLLHLFGVLLFFFPVFSNKNQNNHILWNPFHLTGWKTMKLLTTVQHTFLSWRTNMFPVVTLMKSKRKQGTVACHRKWFLFERVRDSHNASDYMTKQRQRKGHTEIVMDSPFYHDMFCSHLL